MDSFEDINTEIERVRHELELARASKNIYLTARYIQVLEELGVAETLKQEEEDELQDALARARAGEEISEMGGQPHGYKVARLLALCKKFNIATENSPTDKVLFREAEKTYIGWIRNSGLSPEPFYKQVASLLVSLNFIGIEWQLSEEFTEEERKKIEEEKQRL